MNFFKLVKTKDCFTMGVQTTIPDSDSLDGSKCSLKIVNTSSGREKLSMKIHKKKKKSNYNSLQIMIVILSLQPIARHKLD